MKFCSACGKPVTIRVPDGDNMPRHVCDHCDSIHYQNPKIVVGALPVWENKILLCKRAIEPRYGAWTLPAGFMENAETLEQGALRESHLDFHPGSESLDVDLFEEKDIPWNEIAFRTIHHTLEFYFQDRQKGMFPVHTMDIHKNNREAATSS